ncbi:hypothetical protein ACFUC1_06400 [Pedococcus sp. NPDC057267]|uniref:hypothetical protein n=1 Tax=Pedococcus sp. NPDC057267 TaxID=3346077 RepID=UPI003637C457
MNPDPTRPVDGLVDTFADQWLELGDPAIGEALVADPILVLGPSGTSAIPRTAFLSAVASRASAVDDLGQATTTLAGSTSVALGDRMVLATITWSFRHGDSTRELISDFLLERRDDGLRCVAYLPRTNVMDTLT